jgi:hypothetical protein
LPYLVRGTDQFLECGRRLRETGAGYLLVDPAFKCVECFQFVYAAVYALQRSPSMHFVEGEATLELEPNVYCRVGGWNDGGDHDFELFPQCKNNNVGQHGNARPDRKKGSENQLADGRVHLHEKIHDQLLFLLRVVLDHSY